MLLGLKQDKCKRFTLLTFSIYCMHNFLFIVSMATVLLENI